MSRKAKDKEKWHGKVGLHTNGDKQYLAVYDKRKSTLMQLLENGDIVYLYRKGRAVLNGRFQSADGYYSTVGELHVPENKTRQQTETVLSYDNLKLFFNSKFTITLRRPLEHSPFAYYPPTVYGVETPIVP